MAVLSHELSMIREKKRVSQVHLSPVVAREAILATRSADLLTPGPHSQRKISAKPKKMAFGHKGGHYGKSQSSYPAEVWK